TLKSPSYTKSVSWQHYLSLVQINLRIGAIFRPFLLTIINIIFR
ncbi:transposase, partial [Shigella boydii]